MSDELRAALERARDHKMTPEEMFVQRVSFVYGQQDYDNPNPLSKRHIAEMIAEHGGYPAEWVALVPAASGMEAATAGETPKSGSTEGDSPVGEAETPKPRSQRKAGAR